MHEYKDKKEKIIIIKIIICDNGLWWQERKKKKEKSGNVTSGKRDNVRKIIKLNDSCTC